MAQREGFSQLLRDLSYGLAHGETIERPVDAVPLEHVGPIELIAAVDDPRVEQLEIEPSEGDLPALCWNYSLENTGSESQDGLLEGFLRLKGAQPAQHLEFARRYGPLMICKHGLPPAHRPPSRLGNLNLAGCRCARVEPVSLWDAYVQMFAALVTLAARIEGSPERWSDERVELWKQALWWTGRDKVPWWKPGERADRRALLLTLEYWLGATGVRPLLHQRGNRLRIRLGGGGVLGTLVLQTTLAATRSDGIAFCSECQMPYAPNRRPNPNRRNYCPLCRDEGVPNRDAQRAWRARQERV